MLWSVLMKFVQQVWFQCGGGVAIATITGNRTLNGSSSQVQQITASGANRTVLLPAIASNGLGNGQWFLVSNAGASNNVLVKDSAGTTTVATLTPGDWVVVMSYGSSSTPTWAVLAGTVGLTSLTLTGALTAASATLSGALSAASASVTGALSAGATAITGQLTTTDGVTSGTARIVGGNIHTKQSSTTLTNSNVETTLATHTLLANMLKAGTSVRVRGAVRVTGNAGADTLSLKLRLGGTALLTTTAAALVANDVVHVDFVISSRAAPSAASSVQATGTATVSVAGVHGTKAYVLAPANYATNGTLDVDLRGTWNNASASDIAICEAFVVDVVA
jgi:hypothetical protein